MMVAVTCEGDFNVAAVICNLIYQRFMMLLEALGLSASGQCKPGNGMALTDSSPTIK